ncbi:uncharacterized protein [Rutidosis leptorrhynchoides]|uniref:uncharacterized protein n=1 Tax=Rutidosis leptorrhynchoides TaxID=125765 RepID=UPI003A98EAB8
MNKLTKPISSPGRTEKFPPPLMRFLRSNVGNKSRRRSRASPMFIRKKNTNNETTQEPSSPKVTCIGQVRVRRSKKKKPTADTTATATIRHRSHKNHLCRCFQKLKPRSFFAVLSKWVSIFQCGCCKNSSFSHESPVINATPRSISNNIIAGDYSEAQEHEQENEHEDVVNQGLISKSPPKNAFLLTRCRSAPYRSSSLANKFWESGIKKTGEEEEEEEEEVMEKIKNFNIKMEEINGVNEESKCNESNGDEELKETKAVPLILTKCKSEPARRWAKILV